MTDITNDLLVGTGYEDQSFESWFTNSQQPVEYNDACDTPGQRFITTTETIATWHPPVPAIPAIPAVAPTFATVDYIVTAGWQSSARSINPISQSNYISFFVNSGVYGAFLGIGPAGMDDTLINSFSNGIIVDGYGVWTMINGVRDTRIRSSHARVSALRVVRQSTNKIVFMVITGNESLIHVSEIPAQIGDLYGYGRLYSNSDIIDDAAIVSGEVQFGRA